MVKSYHLCIIFEKKPFNSSAFQNANLDRVVAKLTGPLPPAEQAKLWKEYQRILADEQPRTFLYYYDELKGIKNPRRKQRGIEDFIC